MSNSIERLTPDALSPLTPRERDVLALLLQDLPHKEIAARLFISQPGVSMHKSEILRKLGLSSYLKLVLFCHRHGLIEEC